MKNCYDGYMLEACKTCEFWKDTETAYGCSAPFPIMHCDAFAEEIKKDNRFSKEPNVFVNR